MPYLGPCSPARESFFKGCGHYQIFLDEPIDTLCYSVWQGAPALFIVGHLFSRTRKHADALIKILNLSFEALQWHGTLLPHRRFSTLCCPCLTDLC